MAKEAARWSLNQLRIGGTAVAVEHENSVIQGRSV